MVVISYAGKEANAKIVYYGPGLGGKTTNLEFIYDSVPSSSRGKMVSMKTQTDRTLFFDFLPLDLGELGGFKTRFLLYTVPGQVFYNATRKLVLRGADAVAFIADSQIGKMDENKESLANLKENLADYDLSLDSMPWVIQYNKRDLPEIHTVEELNRELNPENVPFFEAIATEGAGVFETFRGLSKLLLEKLSEQIGQRLVITKHIGPDLGPSAKGAAEPASVVDALLGGGVKTATEQTVTSEEAVQPQEGAQTIELTSAPPSDAMAEEPVEAEAAQTDEEIEELELIPEETEPETKQEPAPAPTLQAEGVEPAREREPKRSFFDRWTGRKQLELEREMKLTPETPEPAQAEPAREEWAEEKAEEPETVPPAQEEMKEPEPVEPPAAVEETPSEEVEAPVSHAEEPTAVSEPPLEEEDSAPDVEEELTSEREEVKEQEFQEDDVKPHATEEEPSDEEVSFLGIVRRNNVGVFQKKSEQRGTPAKAKSAPGPESKSEAPSTIETTVEVPVLLKPGESVKETTVTIRLKLKIVSQEAETVEHDFLLDGVSR